MAVAVAVAVVVVVIVVVVVVIVVVVVVCTVSACADVDPLSSDANHWTTQSCPQRGGATVLTMSNCG